MGKQHWWVVMDQDGDRIAETVIETEASTKSAAVLEALEHYRGRLMGVVMADWSLDPDSLCKQVTADPIKIDPLETCKGLDSFSTPAR